MQATAQVTGRHMLPRGGVITIPNEKATSDVFAVHFDDDNIVDAIAIRSQKEGEELGFTRYVIPNNWTPGKHRLSLVPTDMSIEGAPFVPHTAVVNDPREIIARVAGLPGGADIEWNLDATGVESHYTAGEARFTIRGETKSGVRVAGFLQLDITATKELIDFEIGLTFHDEQLGQWFVEGNEPTITFKEAEVIQQRAEFHMHDTDDADNVAEKGMWHGAMYTVKGTLVAWRTNAIEDTSEDDFVWQNDGSVGVVHCRLDASEWDGYFGPTRKVLHNISPTSPLPYIYFSTNGCRNVDSTPQPGGREAFGWSFDTAALVQEDLDDVFSGLWRGVMGEATRPHNWFAENGRPIDIESERPGCTTYGSAPDFRFSTDLLGNPRGWFRSALTPQDDAHMTHRYTFTLFYLTGSRLAREVLYAQANVMYAQRSLMSRPGQPRGHGRTCLFAAQFWCITTGPWKDRMEHFARTKFTAVLASMESSDSILGVADFRTAPMYFGASRPDSGGYTTHLDNEDVAMAGFMSALGTLGVTVWHLIKPDIVPPTLMERNVRIAETVMRYGVHFKTVVPHGEILTYPYVMGWGGGAPITDRTPRVRISVEGNPSFAVRSTLYPLVYLVRHWGTDEQAKINAEKLVAVDGDSFGNARWRAISSPAS